MSCKDTLLTVVCGLFVNVVIAEVTLGQIGNVNSDVDQSRWRRGKLKIENTVGPFTFIPKVKGVTWEGIEYSTREGIKVLSRVVQNSNGDPMKRIAALDTLKGLGVNLRGTEAVFSLMEVYRSAPTIEEKAAALWCLVSSRDGRAVRLFRDILEREGSVRLRLPAAAGLAGWNIRAGVRELIRLFPSMEKTRLRTVGGEALNIFHHLNVERGWGCPEADIDTRALSASSGVRNGVYAEVLLSAYRQWFQDREDQFPTWNPTDPIPGTAGGESDSESERKNGE